MPSFLLALSFVALLISFCLVTKDNLSTALFSSSYRSFLFPFMPSLYFFIFTFILFFLSWVTLKGNICISPVLIVLFYIAFHLSLLTFISCFPFSLFAFTSFFSELHWNKSDKSSYCSLFLPLFPSLSFGCCISCLPFFPPSFFAFISLFLSAALKQVR